MVPNGTFTRTYGFDKEPDRIVPRFFIESIPDEGATAREGRPIFRDQERVELLMPGNTLNVPVHLVTDEHRQRWPDQYAKFKAGQEMSAEGTPLEQWPILKRSQVMELKALNLFTVEHVANMPDSATQRFMGGMRLRQLAKAYLDSAYEAATLAMVTADSEKKDAEISELRSKVSELSTLLNQVHGELQNLKNAPHPAASVIPGMMDPFEIAKQQAQQGMGGISSLDTLPDIPRRKGRPPLPRDEQGNVIRESV